MKFVHISFHFEYTNEIQHLLDRHGVAEYVRYPMIEGMDIDGRHFGSQVFPGNMTVVQAQVPDDVVDPLLHDLAQFRDVKLAHRHLQALVIPVERRL